MTPATCCAALRRMAAAWAACAALALAVPPAVAGVDEVAAGVDAFNKEILSMLETARETETLDEARVLGIIITTAAPRFDFDRITRHAIGKYWRKADDDQRMSLKELFSALLQKTYAKTLAKFNGQELRFVDASEREANSYSVRFIVVHEGKEIRVDYLTDDSSGDWLIFDVKVEGVSLISSYRSQFSQVIRKDGIDALVKLLVERV